MDTPLVELNQVLHPAEVPSEVPHLDRLPTELVELICSWILAHKKTFSEPVSQPRDDKWLWEFTPCSRTLASLSLASKRYRQIAHPYLYSQISIGESDNTWLPRFVSLLCRKPDLGLLIKEIDIQCLPKAFSVEPDSMGPMFNDVASRFSLAPLPSWSPEDCAEKCSPKHRPCDHFKRLLTLLAFLAPNVKRWRMVPPNIFHFEELVQVTEQAFTRSMPSPSNPRALKSLQHLWVPGAQPFPYATDFFALEIALQLLGWLVPSLQKLWLRNASLYHPLPARIKLDNLKEIVIDFGLLTEGGLFSLTRACKVLESFCFCSGGNSPAFPDGWGRAALQQTPPSEFLPEHIVPAFSHLKRTLRILSINRWNGARGGADHNIDLTRENERIYAAWPAWRREGTDSLLGSLKDFRVLETLILDSTCLFHYNIDDNPPPNAPVDHLTKRLPRSLRRLILPGAPPQMVPALHALASSAASGEFPYLRLVQITSNERDVRKRETSWRKYGGPRSLRDEYSTFINIDEWKSLRERFSAARVRLFHINSGNTRCFARELLENAGFVRPESEITRRISVYIS